MLINKCAIVDLTSAFYVSLWWEVYTINSFNQHAFFCFKYMHRKIGNTNQTLETVELCMNRFGYSKFQNHVEKKNNFLK